jgi:hypothetical protein
MGVRRMKPFGGWRVGDTFPVQCLLEANAVPLPEEQNGNAQQRCSVV